MSFKTSKHIVKGFGSEQWRPKPQPFEPSWFSAKLQELYGDRIRIRWSVVDGAWHLEEKVGRASTPPLADNPYRDDYIRARDGYGLVMVVQPGPSMPCPICHLTLQLPVMETVEVVCANCQRKGSDGRHWGAYFPLDFSLLAHLQKIDPLLNDQKHRVRAEHAHALRLKQLNEESQRREIAAQYGDVLREQMPKAGFPSLTLDSWRH